VLEMSEDEDALEDLGEEDGLWFDFTFVEFLKTNYSELLAYYPFERH
jgi:intracellular protein transport protein USO1